MAPRVVLVTGVGRHIGARVAARLAADDSVERVIGVDNATMHGDAAGTGVEFVHADIRAPLIGAILTSTHVDTVVHTHVTDISVGSHGRDAAKELNVIGSMQLLAACGKAAGVRKLVVRSSTAVYGSSPHNPAMFTEDHEAASNLRGYSRDFADVESYVRSFSRRRPDTMVSTLRLANVMSPLVSTALTRYFGYSSPPTVLGFDPRIQFAHLDDCVEALYAATVRDHPGVFNVAGPGVMTLSQAIRRAGSMPLPVPRIVASAIDALGKLNLSGELLDFLTHGRVVDIARLTTEVGYRPRFSTAAAFTDFVRGSRRDAPLPADKARAWEKSLWSGYLRLRGRDE